LATPQGGQILPALEEEQAEGDEREDDDGHDERRHEDVSRRNHDRCAEL